MKRSILISALALSFASTAAFAQNVTAGQEQIAAILGVNASEYTASELGALLAARQNNDEDGVKYFLNHTNRDVRGGVGDVSQGKVQLAAQVGLNPADYTAAELTQVYQARLDGDTQGANFVISHLNRVSVENAPIIAKGRDS